MISLIIFLTGLFVAVAYSVMAAISDYKGMIIPNVFSIIIAAAFVVTYVLIWMMGGGAPFASIMSHLLGLSVVFIGGFALFAMKVWGAGDQKLSSALALWMGFSGVPMFLVYTSIFGGLLGIAALLLRKYKPVKDPVKGSWVDQVQNGAGKVPYGIAIMLGALASFAKIGYFSVDTFRIFLS